MDTQNTTTEMSKKKQHEEEIDLSQAVSKTELFIQKYKNIITGVIAAILVIVLGSYYFFFMYLPPLEEEAQNELFRAQRFFEIDSFNIAMDGDINRGVMGFDEIIDEYGMTKAGNTAKYYMGVSLLQTGDYEGAIDYLEDYSPKDHMTKAIREGAIGDAYVQLGDYETALGHYKKAARAYENDFSTPIYLKKAGLLAEQLEDYETAVEMYEEIKKNYPASNEGRDIEKYLARAQAFTGE